MARVGYFVLETAVARQDNKPFAVIIEPAGGIDVLNGNIIGEGCAPLVISKLAEDMKGLVKENHARMG